MFGLKSVTTLAAIVGLSVCSTQLSAAELTWTGCGISKKAFMSELAKGFEEKTGNVIKISGGGATKGIRSTSAGQSALGGSCRCAMQEEVGKAIAEEESAEFVQVAWDAIVPVVHPDNPVNDISLDQLKDVFDGKITNWKDLGGPDKRIVLCRRAGATSGVGYMFRGLAWNDVNHEYKGRARVFPTSGPLEKYVASDGTWALAVTGISSARRSGVKVINVNGVDSSPEGIASGSHPLTRPLYLTISPTAPLKHSSSKNIFLAKRDRRSLPLRAP